MISIITPWLNHSELCEQHIQNTQGAQVIVIDNGSEERHAANIRKMIDFLGGIYIRNEYNAGFSHANNQGLEKATGDIVVFMNNDVECQEGWLLQVGRDVEPGVLAGPSMLDKYGVAYIEGYCIAARRPVWYLLGGWPDDLPGMYWEDNILCLKAIKAGIRLKRTDWKVLHYSNYTSRHVSGAYEYSPANEARFLEMLDEYRNRVK